MTTPRHGADTVRQGPGAGDNSPTGGVRVLARRYHLIAPLGRGTMGVVWEAYDLAVHRKVAVKEVVLPPDMSQHDREVSRERAQREARAISQLAHPNVIAFYDLVEEYDHPWVVMELVNSRSLADQIRSDGPMPQQRIATLALAVLGALEAAHRAGITHRDVKPSNILLTDDGRVKLTDFGIARTAGDSPITGAGMLVGSPSYIPPEVIQGGEAGPPADMWGLGATLYAAVEARAPFDAGDPMATLHAVVSDPTPPTGRAGPLAPVIDGLLRKDPRRRLDTVKARHLLLDALRAFDRERASAPPPPPAPATPLPPIDAVVETPVELPVNGFPTDQPQGGVPLNGDLPVNGALPVSGLTPLAGAVPAADFNVSSPYDFQYENGANGAGHHAAEPAADEDSAGQTRPVNGTGPLNGAVNGTLNGTAPFNLTDPEPGHINGVGPHDGPHNGPHNGTHNGHVNGTLNGTTLGRPSGIGPAEPDAEAVAPLADFDFGPPAADFDAPPYPGPAVVVNADDETAESATPESLTGDSSVGPVADDDTAIIPKLVSSEPGPAVAGVAPIAKPAGRQAHPLAHLEGFDPASGDGLDGLEDDFGSEPWRKQAAYTPARPNPYPVNPPAGPSQNRPSPRGHGDDGGLAALDLGGSSSGTRRIPALLDDPPRRGPRGTETSGRSGRTAVVLIALIALCIAGYGGYWLTQHLTGRGGQPTGTSSTSVDKSPSGSTPTHNRPAQTKAAGHRAGDYTAYRGSSFAADVPSGWRPDPQGPGVLDFNDPGSDRFIRFVSNVEAGGDLVGGFQTAEQQFASEHQDYHRVVIQQVSYRGYPAADWEFTYAKDGGTRHVLYRSFTVNAKTYGIYISAPDAAYPATVPVFNEAAKTFAAR